MLGLGNQMGCDFPLMGQQRLRLGTSFISGGGLLVNKEQEDARIDRAPGR